jgi:hypothetical protein
MANLTATSQVNGTAGAVMLTASALRDLAQAAGGDAAERRRRDRATDRRISALTALVAELQRELDEARGGTRAAA